MTFSRGSFKFVLVLMTVVLLTSCASPLFGTPTPTATPLPTSTPLPTATPTATPVPYYVNAIVYAGEVQVPILIYHFFGNDDHDLTSMWVTQSVFKEQLQKLYDAGYSLISMTSFLNGNFTVPAGRKPLILTIDDGWYANQLYINDDGTPADYSGIGILWQFAQDHPDFGFHVSINVIMGDKYYGDLRYGDWNYVSEGNAWKIKLANTIVWSIENGVEIFNHTYRHIVMADETPANLLEQLRLNDQEIRNLLALVNRSDLAKKLENVIVAPEGVLPKSDAGLKALREYLNPERKPTKAILAAYNSTEGVLSPSVFSEGYDKYQIPRVTATNFSIDWVVAQKDNVPTAQACALGPTDESANGDPVKLQALIESALQTGSCPEGVYNVGGLVFVARGGSVSQYQ